MKKEELMIGDWVYNTHNSQYEKVYEIGSGLVMLDYNDLYEYDEIEPIPLKRIHLTKNGFKVTDAEDTTTKSKLRLTEALRKWIYRRRYIFQLSLPMPNIGRLSAMCINFNRRCECLTLKKKYRYEINQD